MKHRKLMFPYITETNLTSNCSSYCFCPTPDECYSPEVIYSYPPPPPPPPPPPLPPPPPQPHRMSPLPIVAFCFFSAFFLFLILKYCSCCNCLSNPSQPQAEGLDEEQFTDENRGPNMDHPIWLITTVGLQRAVINSITVCKYKKDEGFIEETNCSVCLSEFREDETLRILPKCNHAFHLSCIDTWLSSHTNCPLCRASIVQSSTNVSPHVAEIDQTSYNSNSMEDTHIASSEVLDCDSQHIQVRDGGVCETNCGDQHEGEVVDPHDNETKESIKVNAILDDLVIDDSKQPFRRSLSFDRIENIGKPSSSVAESLLMSPVLMKRSSSYGGKVLQSRYCSVEFLSSISRK